MFEMDAHVGVEVLGLMMMKVGTIRLRCPRAVLLPRHACLSGAKPTCSAIQSDLVQGEQPHCGFPENSYHMNCERLARAGLRVVVVEQV